jgi:hypothetical protein
VSKTAHEEVHMDGIMAAARQWLASSNKAPGTTAAHEHIVESLLAEITRIEALNVTLAEEVNRLITVGATETRRAVAEECAVICETADYVVRNYGCAREIRKQFGLLQ